MKDVKRININKVLITGFVPRDAVINADAGTARFTLGVDNSYYDVSQQKYVNKSVWLNCVLYRKDDALKRASELIKTNSLVYIEGKFNQWKNKDGEYVTEIIVDTYQIQGIVDNNSSNSGEVSEENLNFEGLADPTA